MQKSASTQQLKNDLISQMSARKTLGKLEEERAR
jgi:hypothetical protein